MKKVCVFIGSRANYSSAKSIMKAVQKRRDLELITVVGASAVLPRFGDLREIMKKDGFPITATFYMIIEGENPVTMAKSTGLGIIELSHLFSNLQPDIILVVGDRFDVMAPVIAASYMNILIAHTMGGEVSGTIDESIRHAITKFAHIHFPANEDARQRIIKLGEHPDMVFNVGCPRIDLVKEILDKHKTGSRIDQKEFFKVFKGVGPVFDIEKESFLLVSQHPVTTEFGKNRTYIEETLKALHVLKRHTIMIWPNADAGSDEISKGIRNFRETHKPDWLHLFINLPVDIYIKLMDLCACMIGNSSSAIREGAFIGTPAVNIGTRQNHRIRSKNVVDVNPDAKEIERAVATQINQKKYKSDAQYGNGTAGVKIAEILAQTDVAIQKVIQY